MPPSVRYEDRAGVNALIRGVDRIANSRVPAAVIMCTNRLDAIDPAVRRRAADILTFERPDTVQRRIILSLALTPLDFPDDKIAALVAATGPDGGRDYGFTFSDLLQRLLPAIALEAYPDNPIRPEDAVAVAQRLVPTKPFREDSQ